jgi:hypothetical protein
MGEEGQDVSGSCCCRAGSQDYCAVHGWGIWNCEPASDPPPTAAKGTAEGEHPNGDVSAGDDRNEQQATLRIAATVQVLQGGVGQTNTRDEERQARHERNILITQAILAVAAIAALLANICQLRLASRTFETGRRAWVVIGDRVNLPPDAPRPDTPWVAEIFTRNVGESPALETQTTHTPMKIAGTIKHVPDDPRDWDKYRSTTSTTSPTEEPPSRAIIGPGQQKQSFVPMPVLSEDEIGQVEREELGVYIVSWVVYRDIFKHERHTVQCSRLMLKPRRLVDCGGDTSRAD